MSRIIIQRLALVWVAGCSLFGCNAILGNDRVEAARPDSSGPISQQPADGEAPAPMDDPPIAGEGSTPTPTPTSECKLDESKLDACVLR